MKNVFLIIAMVLLPCAVVFAGIPANPVSANDDHTGLTASMSQASHCDYRVSISAESYRGDSDFDLSRFGMGASVWAACAPEPSTLVLCSSGLVFLFGLARKR